MKEKTEEKIRTRLLTKAARSIPFAPMGRGDRPELTAPPEIFYNDEEARKYTTNSRMIEIQVREEKEGHEKGKEHFDGGDDGSLFLPTSTSSSKKKKNRPPSPHAPSSSSTSRRTAGAASCSTSAAAAASPGTPSRSRATSGSGWTSRLRCSASRSSAA